MAYHNKYHEVDYTRKWTERETERMMKAVERADSIPLCTADKWEFVACGLRGRTPEACRHRWRTVVAHVDKPKDRKRVHRWTPQMVKRARNMMQKGVLSTKIARILGVTKYAVWHKTKESADGK